MSDANDGSNNGIPWNVTMPTMSYSDYAQWQNSQQFNPTLSAQSQHDYNIYRTINQNIQGPVLGLQALFAACTNIYPDQPNPLQVTARLKYWLGGPDPLDYISMYWNTGCPDLEIPPHWHYVSFGLSDLHGDGRVHPLPPVGPPQPEQISGMGLELSFRMIGEPGHPPTWPATLLQRLATYVFRTGNRLFVGDHVSWHSALDGSDEINQTEVPDVSKLSDQISNNTVSKKKTKRKLKIRHMLVAQDPQLGTVDTPLGKVQFVQIVGITDAELKVSQRSGGSVVLDALASDSRFGGAWLVTNPQRNQSISLPNTSHSPSDLSGVAAICRWELWEPNKSEIPISGDNHRSTSELPVNIKEQIKSVLQKGLSEISIHSKDSNIVENPESLSKTFSTNLTIKSEIDSNIPQSEAKGFDENVCKMSTDSIKLPSNDNSLKNSFLFRSSSNQKVTNMSTDSFEMSKVGAALIEDIMHLPSNASNSFNIKKESELVNPTYDIKSDFPTDKVSDSQTDKNIQKIDNYGEIPSSNSKHSASVLDCDCQKNNEKTCAEINANITSNPNNTCNKCTVDNMWDSSCVPLQGVHLIFDKEAGSLLPSALRCRVLHGRHFTWTAMNEIQAITLVATSVSGALVSPENSIVANNGWLQILISEDFAKEMAEQIEPLLITDNDDSDSEESQTPSVLQTAPLIFMWPQNKLKISILNSI
ncbi:suppressor of fused domain protein [Arctopsyche grandis]|uniref:suppressor of fused domain protein n=1 Tax=Arctopsyche grandis TaxID=121162 RepID=UPI00406D8085